MYRVRQTCMKMLVKRGYNVLQEHVNMSSEAFVAEFGAEPSRNDLTLFVEKVRSMTGGGMGGMGAVRSCLLAAGCMVICLA